MKSFFKFLKENNVDESIDIGEEEIYSVVNGDSLVKEDVDYDNLSFDEIADLNMNEPDDINEDEVKSEGGVSTGFGGEEYVSLDAPSLMDDETITNESKSIKKNRNVKPIKQIWGDLDDIEVSKDVQDRLLNFRISDDGYTVLRKDQNGKEWKPLTKDEIKELVDRTNTEDRYGKKSHYEISPDGTVYTVDNEDATKRKILGKRYRTSFLKNLNTAVNALGKHYDYKGDSATLKVNKSEYVDDGSTGNEKFKKLQYGDIDDSDIKLILSKSNPNKENKKPKSIVGFENGHFTKDGVEMTSKQLVSFVRLLNGQVGDMTKLLNPRAWGKSRDNYWKSYKISIAGSKVGRAVNFNLPPGKNGSCRSDDLPCAQKCYAIKAYAMYPAVKGACDCNFELLKKDTNFNLFKKSLIYALTAPTRNKEYKFDLCRIHVSGDFFSAPYMKAVFDVARACGHIKFWAYTKQYEILSEVGIGNIPKNFCMIVSCWGEFNPFKYKGGKYAHLAKLPLAYLDDGSKEYQEITAETQKMLGKPGKVQVCPCTTADQIITRCEDCRICFDKLKASENLVFKEH